MRVTDSSGHTWRVGRTWLPWRRRIRSVPDSSLLDLSGFDGGDDPVTTAIGLIFMVIGLVVALPVILVFLGLVFEIAILLALVPLVVAVRVALGRPWTVQVIGPDHVVRHTEKVVGWQASGERIAQLGDQIRHARQGISPA